MPLKREFYEGDKVLLRKFNDPEIDRTVIVSGMGRYFGKEQTISHIDYFDTNRYFCIESDPIGFHFPESAIECVFDDSFAIDEETLMAIIGG